MRCDDVRFPKRPEGSQIRCVLIEGHEGSHKNGPGRWT